MGAYLMRLQLVNGLDVAIGAYAGLLACANTVMARAITVPSTPRRTLLASVAAMAMLVPASVFAGGSLAAAVNVTTGCAVSSKTSQPLPSLAVGRRNSHSYSVGLSNNSHSGADAVPPSPTRQRR